MSLQTWYRATPRAAIVVAMLILLTAFTAAAIALASPSPPPNLPSPLGTTRNGMIAFDSGGQIYVIDQFGEGRQQISGYKGSASAGLASGPLYSPDGRRLVWNLAADWGGRILVTGADGSNPVFVSGDLATRPLVQEQASWAPDSRQLVFSGRSDEGKVLFVVAADGSGLRQVTDGSVDATYPAWSPDGSLIAFRGRRSTDPDANGIYVVSIDGSGQRLLHTTPNYSRDQSPPVWSPDGRWLTFDTPDAGGNRQDILSTSITGSETVTVVADPLDQCCPAWSPDGKRLAFLQGAYPSVGATGAWEYDLYLSTADGTGQRRVGAPVLEPGTPTWSPDATKVLGIGIYDLDPAVAYPMVVITLDGSVDPVVVPANTTGLGSWQRLAP